MLTLSRLQHLEDVKFFLSFGLAFALKISDAQCGTTQANRASVAYSMEMRVLPQTDSCAVISETPSPGHGDKQGEQIGPVICEIHFL